MHIMRSKGECISWSSWTLLHLDFWISNGVSDREGFPVWLESMEWIGMANTDTRPDVLMMVVGP